MTVEHFLWILAELESASASIPHKLLNGFLHRSCSLSLMNASAHEELKCGAGSIHSKALRCETGQLFCDDQCSVVMQGIGDNGRNTIFFVKSPDEFGAEMLVEFRQNYPFERGEWQSSGP